MNSFPQQEFQNVSGSVMPVVARFVEHTQQCISTQFEQELILAEDPALYAC